MNDNIKYEILKIRQSKAKNLLGLLLMLREANLLIPASINVSVATNVDEDELMPGDELMVKNTTKLNLAMLKNAQGMKMIPAFTDEEELLKGGNAPSLKMNFESICTKLLAFNREAGGVVLDAFGQSLLLPRDLLEKFWNEKPWEKQVVLKKKTLEKGTRIKLGSPAQYPPKMLDAITDYLSQTPSVDRAYVTMMETGEEKSWLIIPITDEEDREEVCRGILSASHGLSGGIPISFLPPESPLVGALLEKIEPFYEKDKGTDEV